MPETTDLTKLRQARVGQRVTLNGGKDRHIFSIEYLRVTGLQWMPVRHALPDLWSDDLYAQAVRLRARFEFLT
jgi:hypothetical protein